MANQATRWVAVDDTDTSITYQGDWFKTNDQFGALNRYGPPHYGSQHATTTNGSLSFTFRGSNIMVYGTSHQVDRTTDPVWECAVDGVKYESQPGPQDTLINQWTLCSIALNRDGEHTFTLSAVTHGTTFYFDLIQYRPSYELKDKLYPTVFMDNIDPGVRYWEGLWKRIESDDVTLTEDNNAKVRVDFNGTRVTWIGRVVSGYGLSDSEASFSVDGGEPVVFTVMALPPGAQAILYHPFFETPRLSRGYHSLEVIHRGKSAPLTMDYLVIDDGDIYSPNLVNLPPIRGTNTKTIETPTGTPPLTTLPAKSKAPIGAIVGGAIGGVALIGIVILIVLFVLKRRKRLNKPNQPPPANAPTSTPPLNSLSYNPPVPQPQPQMGFTNTNSNTMSIPGSTTISDVPTFYSTQSATHRKGVVLGAPNPYNPQIDHPGGPGPPPPYIS